MRVGIDQAISAAPSKGERPSASVDGDEAGKFELLLRQAKKLREPEEKPADGAPRRANWPAIAATLAGKAGRDEIAAATAERDDDAHGLEDRKANGHAPAPLQSNGQWLLATHDTERRPFPPTLNLPPHGGGKAQGSAHATHQDIDPAVDEDAPPAGARMPKTATTPVAVGRPHTAQSLNAPLDPETGADGLSTPPADATQLRARTREAPPAPADNAGHPAADKPTGTPITVTAAQSFPAPAPASASPTIAALAGAIANDGSVAPALSPSAGLAQPTQPVAVASHLLKIELHPAELGMVTANLRLSGGQLSIELQPDNQEAHRRLSADSEALVKSLQGLGFNVDKITVLQPSVVVPASPRSDAAPGPTGRDAGSSQPGNPGGNGDPSGDQNLGRNRGDDGQPGGNSSAPVRDRAGGGLFI